MTEVISSKDGFRKIGKLAALSLAVALTNQACVNIGNDNSQDDQDNISPHVLLENKFALPNPQFPEPVKISSSEIPNSLEISPSAEVEISEKPNIVIIMMDDVNPIDGRLWRENRMPTVYKTFVEGGMEFEEYYAETALCCPARVGFLTGQHTRNHGVLNNDEYTNQFRDSETIATELQDAGYYTFITGKLLNNFIERRDKTIDGFTKQAIFNEKNGKYYNYTLVREEGSRKNYGDRPGDYSTDVISDLAVKFLRQAPKDKPVFALITPFAAHGPTLPAPKHVNDPKCKNIRPWNAPDSSRPKDLTRICESLLSVDDLVRKVKRELKEQGRLQNTIFIFTADNGMAWGQHGEWTKSNPWAHHIPFYVSWPKEIPAGISETDVFLNIDLAPTLAQAAGTEMGPYPNGQEKSDGISFYSTLSNQDGDPNLENDRQLILEDQPVRPTHFPKYAGLRTTESFKDGNFHYFITGTGKKYLYDLDSDPREQRNVADDPNYSETIKFFSNKLRTILKGL